MFRIVMTLISPRKFSFWQYDPRIVFIPNQGGAIVPTEHSRDQTYIASCFDAMDIPVVVITDGKD